MYVLYFIQCRNDLNEIFQDTLEKRGKKREREKERKRERDKESGQ